MGHGLGYSDCVMGKWDGVDPWHWKGADTRGPAYGFRDGHGRINTGIYRQSPTSNRHDESAEEEHTVELGFSLVWLLYHSVLRLHEFFFPPVATGASPVHTTGSYRTSTIVSR